MGRLYFTRQLSVFQASVQNSQEEEKYIIWYHDLVNDLKIYRGNSGNFYLTGQG